MNNSSSGNDLIQFSVSPWTSFELSSGNSDAHVVWVRRDSVVAIASIKGGSSYQVFLRHGDSFITKDVSVWLDGLAGFGAEQNVNSEASSTVASENDGGAKEVAENENTEVQLALQVISRNMKRDEDFAWGWHSSIACAYMDEGASHRDANEAAARFMLSAFGVDVKQTREWRRMEFHWYAEECS